MSVVKINAITVPRDRVDELVRRFANRAGKVEAQPGFEGFQLLCPNDDRDQCLVVTQWRSEDDFQAWLRSRDFAAGHAHNNQDGPVATHSELWSFDVVQSVGPVESAAS